MPSYDMSQEKEMVQRELMPAGERKLKIINVEEKTSKAGNAMLEWTVIDTSTGAGDVICTVAVQGKRWAMKNMLDACGVKVANGEIYNFELCDLKDKIIIGVNKPFEDKYIDRKGEAKKQMKNKFTTFMPYLKKEGDEEIEF
jgi:hypothetical protein